MFTTGWLSDVRRSCWLVYFCPTLRRLGFGGRQKCCPDNTEFDDDGNDADDDDDYDDDSDADDDDDSNEYDDDDYDDSEYDDNGMFYFLFRLLQ